MNIGNLEIHNAIYLKMIDVGEEWTKILELEHYTLDQKPILQQIIMSESLEMTTTLVLGHNIWSTMINFQINFQA